MKTTLPSTEIINNGDSRTPKFVKAPAKLIQSVSSRIKEVFLSSTAEDASESQLATAPSSKIGSTNLPQDAAQSGLKQLFAPTTHRPSDQTVKSVSIGELTAILEKYLSRTDLQKVRAAYRFSDEAHLGQFRQSGEPYISHPVAVAEICASWKLDVHAIMAALLHDTIEDQGVSRIELSEKFGLQVADLVDGLSKLDKIEFQSREEAQAENFRKMLLAMAKDVRVILIKLADRLHNMRTLGAVSNDKRRRIAKETMEIFAPIAHRLGLNNIYRELQDLGFSHSHPKRHIVLDKAVKSARGNRREVVNKILDSVRKALPRAGLEAEIFGREKTLFAIYRKMKDKHLSFSQVLDIYGFRVVVKEPLECYQALGVLHAIYKPVTGKFKDYIAIPKVNGYQSLHTTVIGPFGTPVEFQIRTREMHRVAESGVAAHWLYKNDGMDLNSIQKHTHQWLQSLLDIQSQTGDATEFLEHVKVDLFPDAVYVFTPKSKILALPRGATALDFAYAIHSDLGNQCVAIKLNGELAPLRTELQSGDVVEIITAPYSTPSASWLTFVCTAKARSNIRHFLKTSQLKESVALGERILGDCLKDAGILLDNIPENIWQKLFVESGINGKETLFADIGLGTRVPLVIAKRILTLLEKSDLIESLTDNSLDTPSKRNKIIIGKNDNQSITYAHCCHPIPGDNIVGYIGKAQSILVHRQECSVSKRIQAKNPERWIDVEWAEETSKALPVSISIKLQNQKGVLAKIAAELNECETNILHVSMMEYLEPSSSVADMQFLIEASSRTHLANIIRRIRELPYVLHVSRSKPQASNTTH